MQHAKALGIKFVFTAVILLSLFAVFVNARLWEMLIVALVVTAISYIVGDLFILPKFGHLTAVISDFVLSLLVIWGSAVMITSANEGLFLASLISAMVLTFCEALFHSHMSNHVVKIKGSESPEQREKEEQEKPAKEKREEKAQEKGLTEKDK